MTAEVPAELAAYVAQRAPGMRFDLSGMVSTTTRLRQLINP